MSTTVNKPRVFVLTSRVYETAGGRTKATITRTMFLQQHFDTTLLEMSSTKYPGKELPAVFEKYQTKFNVDNPWGVNAHGVSRTQNYIDFLKDQTGCIGDSEIFNGVQKSFVLSTLSGEKIKGYLDGEKIARLRTYHHDGRVDFFALDSNQNIFLRELYDKDVLLARYYLDVSGKVCSGFVLDDQGKKEFIYRATDDQLFRSKDIIDHNVAFLNDILRDGDVLISDVRYYDNVLEKITPDVKKIHVWHEIAVDLPDKTGINPAYERIVSPSFSLSDSDRIVVFTDDAHKEYSTKFPHLKNKFSTIPYGIDLKDDLENIERDKNLVVSVGRLIPSKNVADQLRAFAIFNTKYPETTMQIFGEGDDTESLRQLVTELDLNDSVKFCGFSNNIDETFQSAGMMIFSSNNETFGLTILESMSNGTPVASYNVRFGANMMINNSRNGIISKENTPEALANAMIKLYKSKLRPKKVRKSIGTRFSREGFENTWLEMIADSKER